MKRRESSPLFYPSPPSLCGIAHPACAGCGMSSDSGRRSDRHVRSPAKIVAENTNITAEQMGEGDISSQESASKRQRISTESPRKVPLSTRRRISNGRLPSSTTPPLLEPILGSTSHPSSTTHSTPSPPTTPEESLTPSPRSPASSPFSSPATTSTTTATDTPTTQNSSNSNYHNSNNTSNTPNINSDQNSHSNHPTIQTNTPSVSSHSNFVELPVTTQPTLPQSGSHPLQANSHSATEPNGAVNLPFYLNPDTPVLSSATTISTTPSLSLSACLDASSIKTTNPPKSDKVSQKEALYCHLEDIVRQYEGGDMACKFKLSTICKDLKRAEYTEFITEHFKAVQLVKDKKKDLRTRRKAHQSNYHEEIRQMMHGFGDIADAHLESAKFIELLVKKFLVLLIASIKAVLPDFSKPKINAEVLSVALLPDVKRVHRIQQGIQLLIQRRRLRHAEETSTGPEGPAEANGGGEFENLTVEELETLSTEAHVPHVPTAQTKHKLATKDETSSTLFETPYWTTLFRKAAEECEKDKLERHRHKDRVSQAVPADGFAYFTQCTNASFTKPNQKKLIEFMQAHCGLLEDMELTSKVVEMVGLLTYDFVMEIVTGILKKRVDLKISTGIEPLHLANFVSSFSAV